MIKETTSFSPVSADDRKAYRLVEETVRFCNGHYQLPLPWRYDHQLLPDNLKVAQKRLSGLQRCLAKDADMLSKYVERTQSILDAGYAEEVPQDEIKTSGRVWYLPHHGVINPKKPGKKLWVVFDCAAVHKGLSLNQVLMQGPDLVNNLVGVLLRSRRAVVPNLC